MNTTYLSMYLGSIRQCCQEYVLCCSVKYTIIKKDSAVSKLYTGRKEWYTHVYNLYGAYLSPVSMWIKGNLLLYKKNL